MAIADAAADEHLEVQVAEEKLDWYLARLPTMDRCSWASRRPSPTATRRVGTNHVLPTSRAARYTGGLWVGQVPQDRAPTSA